MATAKNSSIVFGFLFLVTGIFCIVGSLFAWGKGWLFSIHQLDAFLLPMADLLVTAPLSLITSYGLLRKKSWGIKIGLVTAGIYFFGSVLVFIIILWNKQPYPLELIIPSVSGCFIALWFLSIHLFKGR